MMRLLAAAGLAVLAAGCATDTAPARSFAGVDGCAAFDASSLGLQGANASWKPAAEGAPAHCEVTGTLRPGSTWAGILAATEPLVRQLPGDYSHRPPDFRSEWPEYRRAGRGFPLGAERRQGAGQHDQHHHGVTTSAEHHCRLDMGIAQEFTQWNRWPARIRYLPCR